MNSYLGRLNVDDLQHTQQDSGGDVDRQPEVLAAGFTQPQNALVFAGYTLLALAVGTVLLHRGDPN